MTQLSFPPPAEDGINQPDSKIDFLIKLAFVSAHRAKEGFPAVSSKHFPICINLPSHLKHFQNQGEKRLDIPLSMQISNRISGCFREELRQAIEQKRENVDKGPFGLDLAHTWMKFATMALPFPHPPGPAVDAAGLANTDGWRRQAFSISKSSISSIACQKAIVGFCAGLGDEMCS